MKSPRFRCPKNGRFARDFDCMYCENPGEDEFTRCIDMNKEYFDKVYG